MKFTQASIHSFRPPTGKADHIEWDDAMPGFGIRHRQGGHGAYLVQYKIGEQTRRQSLGRVSKVTLEAARVLARRYFADVADKVDPALKRASKVASASVSIEALITSYLERQARAGCKPRTIDENRMYLSKHWKEIKGDPIKSIDRASVARQLNIIREENGPVSANKARSNLKTFFNWAISEGHCDVNPVENTNVNHTESRSHVLEPRELRAIWQHLPDDCYGKVSRLLVLTGFRLNEAAGLVRSEINFEDKQIELPKERTKNSKPFIMPLSPFALSLIPTDKNDLLFPNPIGKKYTRAARKITRFAEFVRV